MDRKNIKIVIGANYGDEGKGLATDYFAHEAEGSTLVVMHNGGAQRGHTVTTPDGRRHVFHHFSAGTFACADTYMADTFIVNPIIFNQEKKELSKIMDLGLEINIFINANCRVTTPFDMIYNQIMERERGNHKHGSCGLGIHSTIVRHGFIPTKIHSLILMDKASFKRKMYLIKNYYLTKLKNIATEEDLELLNSEIMIDNFFNDFINMLNSVQSIIHKEVYLFDQYENIIFEGAQGLLLDQNNIEEFPHLTPSFTGLENPINIIKNLWLEDSDIEVCFVSRTYMTRHGAGNLEEECSRESLGIASIDQTNLDNEYQDSIRYAPMNYRELHRRIELEAYNYSDLCNFKTSIMMTHANIIEDMGGRATYIVTGETRNDITKIKNFEF